MSLDSTFLVFALMLGLAEGQLNVHKLSLRESSEQGQILNSPHPKVKLATENSV